jgi:hypothetical protein
MRRRTQLSGLNIYSRKGYFYNLYYIRKISQKKNYGIASVIYLESQTIINPTNDGSRVTDPGGHAI